MSSYGLGGLKTRRPAVDQVGSQTPSVSPGRGPKEPTPPETDFLWEVVTTVLF